MEESGLGLVELLLFCVVVIFACTFVVLWAYSTRDRDEDMDEWSREVDKLIKDADKMLNAHVDEIMRLKEEEKNWLR